MPTSVIIDIIIAAVLILFAWLGWKRGLLRTLSELLVVVVAVVLANQIANAAAPKVVDTFLRPAAHEAIEAKVDSLDPGGQLLSHDSLASVLDGVPFVGEHVKGLLEDKIISAQDQALAEGRNMLLNIALDLADTVLDGVIRNLVRSVIFALCFALLTILLRLAVKMLNLTFSLPGLRQLNEVGGMLIGLGKGTVIVCLAVWVLALAGVLTEEVREGSYLLGAAAGLTGLFTDSL